MQHFGIKVSIIEPGFFKTAVTRLDLIEADLRRLWTRIPQDVKDSYGVTYFDDCKWKCSKLQSVSNKCFKTSLLCFGHQMWKLRTSPWASYAAQTSPRWPGVCRTPWLLVSHAHVTAQAGTPNFSGFLCPTSRHLCQTLSSMCFFLYLKMRGSPAGSTSTKGLYNRDVFSCQQCMYV